MNWIKDLTKSFGKKQSPKILTIKRTPSRYIKVTSNEYYQFWAFFLAKPKVDLDCLFLSLTSLPERLRFAIYLKALGSRAYTINAIKTEDDSEIVSQIFDICGRNPLNREKAIFNIYKTLEYDSLLDFSKQKSTVIKVILYFLSMECSSEEGTYSILLGLIEDKGLFEYFDQISFPEHNESNSTDKDRLETKLEVNVMSDENILDSQKGNSQDYKVDDIKKDNSQDFKVEDSQDGNQSDAINETHQITNKVDGTLKELWEMMLSDDLKVFTTITDSLICLKDATYHQVFARAIEVSPSQDPCVILSILAVPSNKSFYKIEYYRNKDAAGRDKSIKKMLKAENKLVDEQSYYEFLIIQNKLIEAQEELKKEFNSKIEDLESKNKALQDENTSLKNKIKGIETHLG